MKFHENRSKVSGDMERNQKCYGQTDGLTKGIPMTPFRLRGGGLIIFDFFARKPVFWVSNKPACTDIEIR